MARLVALFLVSLAVLPSMVSDGVRTFSVQAAVAAYLVREGQPGCTVNLLLYDRLLDADLVARLRQWEGQDLNLDATRATAALVLKIPEGFVPEGNWMGDYVPVQAELRYPPTPPLSVANPRLKVTIRHPWLVSVEGSWPGHAELTALEAQVLTVRYLP